MNQPELRDLRDRYRTSFEEWARQVASLGHFHATIPRTEALNDAQSNTNEAEDTYRERRDRLTDAMLAMNIARECHNPDALGRDPQGVDEKR